MNRWSAGATLLLAVAGALALRCPRLDTRPLHNDEGVNALKVSELWQQGRYRYDPEEFHGPTLYYASLPFLWSSDARSPDELTDTTLRLATVAFGTALILLLLLFADGLGCHTIGWAAVFTAVSPAMVFYSRYFIHEMLLVFFTTLTIGAGWRYFQTRRSLWAIVAGVGIGLMFATKETFVINLAAMALALVAVVAGRASPPAYRISVRHAGLSLLAAFVVWLVLFSSFFTHFGGLTDSIRAFLPWLKRAGGHSPHIHPWNFYLERLAWFHPAKSPVWSEGLILVLAAVGTGVSLFGRKTPLHRFLAIYTIVLTAAYSALSYKTPWCLLGFLQGLILLAGIGAATLVERFRARALKVLIVVLLLATTLQLTWQSWRASFVYPADPRNPYVYAQTAPDVLNLVRKVEGVAQVAPAGRETVVKVIAPESDYGPLPWFLRRLNHVGWYDAPPADPFAPIIVASTRLDTSLGEKLDKKWVMVGLFELRPGNFLELYVERGLWGKFVVTLPRDKENGDDDVTR